VSPSSEPASAAALAASSPALLPSSASAPPKRPRDDEPAAAAGGLSKQKQADAAAWDCVRVHRVGTAGLRPFIERVLVAPAALCGELQV
jgi:hypothetical protein